MGWGEEPRDAPALGFSPAVIPNFGEVERGENRKGKIFVLGVFVGFAVRFCGVSSGGAAANSWKGDTSLCFL